MRPGTLFVILCTPVVGCSDQGLAGPGGSSSDDEVCPCVADSAHDSEPTAGACPRVTSPEALEQTLVGTWGGSVFTFDHEAAVTLDCRADLSFRIDFSGDDGNEATTCSNMGDYSGGVSWEVFGPTMVMLSDNNPNYPACGEPLERAALTNIWITPDCTLTGYSESPTFWENTNKGIFRLRRE
jgi:hypothetical protein